VSGNHAWSFGASDLGTEYWELLQLLTETGRQHAMTAIANKRFTESIQKQAHISDIQN